MQAPRPLFLALLLATAGSAFGQNLVNLSTLAQAGGPTALTSGFVIAGGQKTVLIRAVGPTLTSFGVSGALPHPILNLFAQGASTPMATNNVWGSGTSAQTATLQATFTQVGAFALPAGSLDAALVITLQPGNYSAQVTASGGGTGMCLIEIYDVSGAPSELINLSTLLPITSAAPPTLGFVVSPGTSSRVLLIRNVGPSLANFGVTGVLATPSLAVVSASSGQILAQNTGWTTGNVTSLSLAFTQAGAFPLNNPSADAAIVSSFVGGSYSIQATGNGNSGTALVEIYDITPTGPNPVSLAATSASADNSGNNPGVVTFTRGGDLTLPLTVSYATSGSAVSGTDYSTLPGSVTFAAGAATVTQTITPLPTISSNPSVTAILTVVAGTGYTVGAPAAAAVTITHVAATLYTANLRPASGATGSTAYGSASIVVNPDGTLSLVNVSFSNLSSTEVVAHLEIGAPGPNASYVFNLNSGQVSGQQWTFTPAGPYSASALLAALQSGNIFVEVDTGNYPNGELTGTFSKSTGSQVFTAPAAPPTLPASALGANTDATNAVRLLTQATFGPTPADLATVMKEGVSAWITSQMAEPVTSHLAALRADGAAYPNPQSPTAANYFYFEPVNAQAAWWQIALTAPDQLRQRVAFALSELFVISRQGAGLNNAEEAMANYYDLLAGDAFGNFRQLLQDVTLSPVMGTYLSTIHNEKADPAAGVSADENYAREVQQLFTVGLVMLNPDGTLQLDGTGQPIPTYNQSEIVQTANVFTGWSFASPNGNFFYNPLPNGLSSPLPNTNAWLNPMTAYETYHDTTQKTILGGAVVPAGGTAEADLKIELDTLFNHQNTGPFVCKQLIQHLVTSNPSPGYVYRVAQVFANDGTGTRGNLAAVVTAILSDYEARTSSLAADAGYGKLKEPLLRMSGLLRALNVTSQDGRYVETAPNAAQQSGLLSAPDGNLEEEALDSNTVFNFFAPGYVLPGAVAAAGLVAPEFQITDAASSITVPNDLYTFVFNRQAPQPSDYLLIDYSALTPLASTPTALLSQLSLLFCSNQMSAAEQARITSALSSLGSNASALELAENAVYLTVTSSEAAIQR